MKVLLCEDVKELGYFGDVVEVADGYARNHLLPNRLAIIPTEDNLRSLADEKTKRSEHRIQQRKHLEAAAEKTKDAEAVIAAKANELGHLFGSVTVGQIAENLRAQGLEVADEIVNLKNHIKECGTHTAELKFTDDIVVPITVTVVAEGQPIPVPDESADESQTGKSSEGLPKEDKPAKDSSKKN